MIKMKNWYSMLINILFVAYLFSIVAFGDRYEYYKISNTLFIALVLTMIIDMRIIRRMNIPIQSLMLVPFVIFSLISYFWSVDVDLTYTRVITLVELLVLMMVMTLYLESTHECGLFIRSFLIAGVLVLLYVVSFYGVSGLQMMLKENTRVGTEIVNANTLAIYLAISVAICYSIYLKRRIVLMLIPIVFFVAIIALTGSKKGIIDLVIGVLTTFVLFSNPSSTNGNLGKWIFRFMIILGVAYCAWQLPIFNTVRNRFEMMFSLFGEGSGPIDYSTKERKLMIEYGIQQLYDTPLLGVGIGASGYVSLKAVGDYNTYLHNNYVELLATGGIIGFLLYYVPIFKILKKCIEKRKTDDNAKICIVLLSMFLVNDIAAVQYFSKITYIILGIAVSTIASESPSYMENCELIEFGKRKY